MNAPTESDTNLKNTIQREVIAAMKAKDKARLATIRLITAAIKQIEVDERIELDNTRVIAVLDKMVKQRRESISQFKTAGRDELVEQEAYEINIIQEFLPQPLSDEEIESIVNDAISKCNACTIKDMGKVMGIVKPQIVGRADMGEISGKIKATLSGGS